MNNLKNTKKRNPKTAELKDKEKVRKVALTVVNSKQGIKRLKILIKCTNACAKLWIARWSQKPTLSPSLVLQHWHCPVWAKCNRCPPTWVTTYQTRAHRFRSRTNLRLKRRMKASRRSPLSGLRIKTMISPKPRQTGNPTKTLKTTTSTIIKSTEERKPK